MDDKKSILYFCSTTHALIHAVILSFAVLIGAIQNTFNISLTQTMAWGAISVFIYGTAGIPAGYFSDKFGSLKMILTGMSIAMLSCVVLFFSFSPWMFIIGMVGLGFGSGFYHPSGISILSKYYGEKERGRAMGTHGFLGNFGQFGAPLIASGLLVALGGWREVYIFWGGVFAVMITWGLFMEFEGYEPEVTGKEARLGKLDTKFLLQSMILILLVITVLRGWYYRGTVKFIPTYVKDAFGAGDFTAGIYGSLLLLGGGVSQIIGGHMRDRMGSKKPIIIFAVLSTISLILLLTHNLMPGMKIIGGLYLGPFLIGVILFGFAFFGAQPAVNSIVAEYTPENIRGGFYGITFFTRFGLSSLAMIMAGFTAENIGMTVPFMIMGVFALVSIPLAMMLKEVDGEE